MERILILIIISNMPNRKQYDLTVMKVKDLSVPIQFPREIDDRLPEPPCVLTSIMVVRSGKSNLFFWLLNSEQAYGGIFDLIYIISPTIKTDRTGQQWMREEFKDKVIIHDDMSTINEFIKDILDYQSSFDVNDEDNQPPLIAIVLDDISGYIKRNSFVNHLFSRYRHYNVSLFIANQSCKDLPCIVRSQTTGLFLSKCHSFLEKSKILEEFAPIYENRLLTIWDECVKERYNYCYLKLDDIEPRIFKIGKDGCQQINWRDYEIILPHELVKYIRKNDKKKLKNK